MVELILMTMNANSFNYIHPDLTSGVHTVVVTAKIETACVKNGAPVVCGSDQFADAMASIGKGSMTVDEIRMIKDEVVSP